MIGVKDEAELHMLLVICVVGPGLPYAHQRDLSLSICRASREESGPAAFSSTSRPSTCILVAAERSTRAFTCMHVASRIAGSPNPVS